LFRHVEGTVKREKEEELSWLREEGKDFRWAGGIKEERWGRMGGPWGGKVEGG
jgi:hypothetical protein